MKINTALILCAGFGKRLNPITLNTPKPLLQIKDLSMLERCINLIEKLGIQKILNKIQLIKDKKVINFKNKLYKVQDFNNKILFNESKLFCDWYAPKKLSKYKSIQFKKKFRLEIKK